MSRLTVTITGFVLVAIAMIAAITLSQTTRADGLSAGVTFGAYAQPVGNQNNTDAIVALENDLGRKLPMVRAFSDWDDPLGEDKKFHRWVRDGGRQLMVSIKPKKQNGQVIRWNKIATSQPGSSVYEHMVDLADAAKRYGDTMIVGFHHEPEHAKNTVFGTSSEFRAAFRKMHDVFAAEGATNVQFAWVMTSWSFEVGDIHPNDRRRAELWYPGDDVVDYMSVQTYNWNNCRPGHNEPWESLQSNIEPFMRFARQHPDTKLVLAEWGSDEGAAGKKADWLDDVRALFKSGEYKDRFAAILYFHDDGTAEGWPQCDWWLNSSSSTLNAAKRINNDSFYRVRLGDGGSPPPPPPPPPSTCRYTFVNNVGSQIKVKQEVNGSETTRKILEAGQTKSVDVAGGELWRVRQVSNKSQLWQQTIPVNCQNRTISIGSPSTGSCRYTFVNKSSGYVKLKELVNGSEVTRLWIASGASKAVSVEDGEHWVVRRPTDARRLWQSTIPNNCKDRTVDVGAWL